MESQKVLERMIDVGIVESNDDQVFLTEEFESRRSSIRSAGDQCKPEWLTADLVDPERLDEDFIVTAKTVADFTEDLSHQDVVLFATVLVWLDEPPTSEGTPQDFVPLHQENLHGFLKEHRASVIFVWKPGNPSCEQMADTLSRLHSLPMVDETVGLGSICVADGAELLREEYDVGLLPTTLFFVGQSVDSRIIGPRMLNVVKREVEIIKETACESAQTSL